MTKMNEKLSGLGQIVTGTVCISFSAVFVKLANVGPTASGFYRVLFGGIALAFICLVSGKKIHRGWPPLFWATAGGLFFAADLAFWHHSIHYVGPGLATILANFQVFFLAIIGVTVFRERVSARFVIAIPLAVVGLLLLVGADWSSLGDTYRWGIVFGLMTAVAYTGYILSLRRAQNLAVKLDPLVNLAVLSLITAIALAFQTSVNGESLAIPDARSWAVLLSYGLLCQALGWILISRGIAKVAASRVGLILLLQPTLTFIWDLTLFSRPTTIVEMTGAVTALAAIYMGLTGKSQVRAPSET